jgi:hypothetical protein
MPNGRARPALSAAFLVTSLGQFLLQALAAACGLELQFTSEDVREIALRIYTVGIKASEAKNRKGPQRETGPEVLNVSLYILLLYCRL